jgi:transmembrane sensor
MPATSLRRTTDWQRPFKFAVALVLTVAVGSAVAFYILTPRYDTYATTVGGRETLTLHDGSRIELNSNTVVRVSQNPSRRLVRLDRGEAFFEIRHDSNHPFVVVAAGHRLVDLGTKFSVRADADHLKVALVEGSVRVETKGGQGERTLSPGDVLLASTDGLSVKKQPLQALATTLAWRRGMLVFHETSLLDAAQEFNRYNETKIVIRDPNAGRETINGTLPANDIEEFSRMARNIFGLRTEKRGNEILFAR